jgi:hypothetical protein
MGMQRAPQMAEVLGVPTFYATHCVIENAGNGNVRIWNCTVRGRLLIPNSEVIIPASRLVEIGDEVKAFAQNMPEEETVFAEALAH